MSRIVRDQPLPTVPPRQRLREVDDEGDDDVNLTDEEVDTTFKSYSAPFSTMHVAQMALHTMQY